MDLILLLNSGHLWQALDPDEQRQQERSRFSGTGFSDANDVAILETDGDGLTLDA